MLLYFWAGTEIQEINHTTGAYPPNELKGRTCVYIASGKFPQYRDWTSQGWSVSHEPDIPKELKAFALLLT